MKKRYKAPDMVEMAAEVCDIITNSAGVENPDGGKTEFVQNADFFSWFGEE